MDTIGLLPPHLPTTMVAARLHARGGPEAIVIDRIEVPIPGPADVLVRVYAAAITPSELGWEPTWTTPDGADRTPTIPAHELAGVVAAVGSQVDATWLGQAVLGLTDFFRDGAAAEYVAVRTADLASWRSDIEDVVAAALPLSGLTAWQALIDHGDLRPGERVLILGAAGGVGTFAVQLARWRGAHVIAVASGRDESFLRDLGADEVIDRTDAQLDPLAARVDLVLDTVGGETLARTWNGLGPRGRVVSIAPTERDIAGRDTRGSFFVVTPDSATLRRLTELVEAGALRAVIARTFPLTEARDAYGYGQTAHPRGKVVLRVAD